MRQKSYGSKPKTEGYVNGRYTSGNKATEIKAVDLSNNGGTVSAATNFLYDMTALIGEGVAVNQRVGQQITCTSMDVEANFTINNGNTSNSNYYTWYVVLDKQPNGTAPLVSSIFTNVTSNLNQRTLLNMDRYVVLASEYNDESLFNSGPAGKRHKRFVKLDITSRYSDSIGTPLSNAIYFVVTSNSGTAPNVILCDFTLRLRFADE